MLGDTRETVDVLGKSFGNVLVRKLGEYSLDKTNCRMVMHEQGWITLLRESPSIFHC